MSKQQIIHTGNVNSISVIFILIAVLLGGCVSIDNQEENLRDSLIAKMAEHNVDKVLNQAKLVFYSLPSPIETAKLLERSGASYDGTIINPVQNLPKYMTSKSQALNMGIYSADLSYVSLYNRPQTTIEYMNACKQLSEKLGIVNVINDTIINELKENINKRDIIIDIISNTYIESNTNLEENNRPEIATLMVVGAWVEGLYLATNLAQKNPNSQDLVDIIVDQKLSLQDLITLLELFEEKPEINEVYKQIKDLQIIYNEIQISITKIEAETDEEANITTIKSNPISRITQEQFNEIYEKVNQIRSDFVK